MDGQTKQEVFVVYSLCCAVAAMNIKNQWTSEQNVVSRNNNKNFFSQIFILEQIEFRAPLKEQKENEDVTITIYIHTYIYRDTRNNI